MQNFFRTVKIGLQYRLTIIGIIACSLLVALFWSANIGTIYPMVEVVFQGKSIPAYLDSEIITLEDSIAEKTAVVTRWESEQRSSAEIQFVESQIRDAIRSRDLKQSFIPFARKWLPSTPFDTLVLVIVALMVGTLIKCSLLMANIILVERFSQRSMLTLRNEFYARTLNMSVGSFSNDRTGELMSRFTNDTEALTMGLKMLIGKTVREPLKMIACLGGAAFISWRLLLLCLIVTPIAGLMIGILSKALKRSNKTAMQSMAAMYELIGDTFKSIIAVKAFNGEEYEQHRFRTATTRYYQHVMGIAKFNSLTRPTTEIAGMGIVALAVICGGYLVLNQQTHLLGIQMSINPMSHGEMMTFFAFLIGASDPMRKMADVFNLVQRSAAAADRIYEMLDRLPDVPDTQHPATPPRKIERLVLDKVRFAYDESNLVLTDVSLVIPAGQIVAIIGPNGCGKSTLAKLIPRFYDPQSGTVAFNDIDLTTLKKHDVRARVGLVTQNAILFDDTVMNNLRYGDRQATDDQIYAAAKQAKAHAFITQELDDGYETMVGESGGKLSGGQRQRIALARAILCDPEIMVLDEATSQIDLESEQIILRVLRKFFANRTAILITHQMSTIELADRVIVMDKGQIIDDGTAEQLLNRCPFFQRIAQGDLRESA